MAEIKCECGQKFQGLEGKEDTCPKCLKQAMCPHEKISGIESYAVDGYMEDGTIHLKSYDGGLDSLECENCGKQFDVSADNIEFN